MFSSYKFDAINTRIASISPGAEHFFGTDTYGRDLFVRVWTGTRYSLFIAVVAIFIDVIVGMTYGLISGYFGGKVDSVMQRIQEIINSCLLYTSDAADEEDSVDLGGTRIH